MTNRFDEDPTQAPLDQSNAVPVANPYLTVTQRGLAGLNPDGTPRVSALPAVPDYTGAPGVRNGLSNYAANRPEPLSGEALANFQQWQQQNQPEPAPTQKEYDVMGGLGLIASELNPFGNLGTQLKGAVARTFEEANPEASRSPTGEAGDWQDRWRDEARKADEERRAAAEATGEKYLLPFIQHKDIGGLGSNLGFSAGSMLGTVAAGGAGRLAGGALGSLAGPGGAAVGQQIGGLLGGLAGGGTMAYAQDRQMTLEGAYQKMREEHAKQGKEFTVEDWNKVYNNKDFQDAINDHALWEAGPEAVGNLLFLKLAKMGLAKNLGDSAVKRIAKGAVAFALNQAQEQATETVTQMGQTNAEVAAGTQPEANRRSWSDPSAWAKSWEEIAPQTFLLTSIMGGGTHLAGRAYEKFIQNPRDAESLVTLASDPNIRSALSDTALDNLVLLGEHLSKKVKGNDRIAALAESLKQEQTRRNDDLNYRAQLDQIFGDQTLPDGTTQPGLWTQMEQAKDQPLFGDPLIGTRNKEGKARGDMTVQGLQQLQPILEQGGQTFKTAQQIQAENEWLQGLSDREKADFYANDDARLKNLAQPVTDEYGNQWRFNQNTLQYEPYQLPVSPLTQQQRQAARDAYRQRIGEIAAETQAQQAEIAARTELDDRQKRILQEQADFRARQQMEIEQRKLAQQEASQSVTGGLNEVAPVPQTDSNTIQLQRGQSVELTPPDPSAPVPRSTATAEDEARLRAFMGERPERQPRGLADIPQTPPPPPIKIGNHQVETVTPGALSALEAMREQARKMVSPPQTQPGVTPNAQEVQTQAAPETPVAPLTEPTGNLDAIENTPPSAPDGGSGAQSGVRQEGGRPTEGRQGVQPSGQGREVAAQATQEAVAPATPEWMAFPENSGTLNIPRAEMPQIKAEHRGAMVNFLKGQGVSSETQEITADQLKPTQAEFSPKKVQQARDYQGGNRSILVSQDGYIVDGHHQWLAALESQEPVKAIVLDAPISQLLETVKAFPSAEQAGTSETTPRNTQNDQAQSEQPAPAFTPPQGALLIPESALRNPAGYMRARTSKDWGNRFTLNTLEDGKLYAVPKGEEQTQQDIQTTPPLEPSSEQSETQPKQAEQWWSQELTPQGRRNALKAAGIKQGRAPVLWPHLTKNEQQRLDQVRLIQQDTQESLENTHDTNADYSDSETTLEGNVPGSVPIDAGTQRPGERSPSRSDVDVTGDGGTGSGRDDNTGSVASEPGTVGVQEPAPGLDTTGDERDTNIDALWDHLVNQELGEAPAPATKKNRKSRTTSPRAPSAKPKTTGQQVKEKAGHAASELAQAADKATDGLLNLFFTPGKLSANLSIDSDQYERAKPMFLAAAQHLRNAAADIAEILNLIIQDIVRKGRAAGLDNAAIRQGLENIAPYAKQFAKDVGDGVIILDAAETPENPTQPKGAALTGENPGNYRITAEDRLGQGGDSIKVDQNIAAIRLVKQLEAEGRYATRAEQVVLAKYVGWGGLKGAFAPQGDTQSRWNAKLKALVTDGVWTEKEYNSAWESTADAHYTSQPVIEAMYRFLDHLGFSGGRVLEPTVGVGNFIGLMPDTLTEHSQWFASEIDATTSLIAKHLYPDAQIKTATPFEQAEFPYGRFDLAIGNPPFGSLRIRDNKEQRKELDNWKIHNYVIGKSALHLRPGGVMAMVVTHRFLDTMDDSSKQTRDWLDQNMWFLGAIRLPNTAFKKNAGTDVVTDIVFFMRPDSVMDGKVQPVRNWTDIGHIQRDEKRIPVNRYFADNPHLMFGEPSLEGSMYGDKEEFTLKDTGMDIPAAFDAALQADFAELANVLGEVKANQQDAPTFFLENREDIAIGGYLLEGDKLYLRGDNDEFGNANFQELTPNTLWTAKQTLGQKRYDRLKGLLSLRGKAYALINAEQRDAPNIESLRKALRTDYLAFVKEFGPINSPDSNARLLEADPKIEFGLEKNFRKKITPTRAKAMGVAPREESAEMADILLRRLYYPQQKTLYAKDAIDGFSISLSERGKVDLNYIAELTNTSLLEVVNTLSSGDSPRIFRDPDTQAWVEKDEYLSGNVKQKLKKAQDAGLTENIRALEAVLPNDVKVDDIHIEMGAPWVPSEIYNDFLKVLGITQPTVFITSNGQVLFPDARSANVVSNEFNANLRNSDYTLAEMFVALANKQALIAYDEITDSEGNPRRVVNVQRTKELQPLGKSILKMFNDWIRADMDRANLLEKQYNEQINTTVDREFDGNLLRVKDDALIGANPSIKLRPNQKRAAWRMIVSDNVLMDHVVGAGKTITMIAGIMERRRMGLSKKPLIAVPNHLVGQWAKDFLALYPGARLLAASEKDFAPANRKKLMARMATGDYDAIIIGHSMLTKMPVNPEMRTAFVDQEIEFLEQIRAEMEAAKENKRKISGINKRIDSLRQKLQKSINEDLKDQVVFFEETGVDYLVIDESHEFKNLMYHTNMTPVVGMGDPKGSQKAFDLYMKTSSLQRRQGAVTFATGTPISNSLVEMYAILRYLNPQGLKERKLEAFDAWLKTFAGIEEVTEYTATGQLKARNVLTSFSGVPELLQLYRQFADTVTMEDLKRLYSEAVRTRNAATGSQERTEFPIPKVAGGKRQLITVPISPQQRMFVDYLTLRAKKLEGMTGAERKEYATTDNPLWIYSDARKAALDIRVVDPTAMDDAGSKVNRAVSNIKRIYDQTAAVKGTQLVFSDLSTPKKVADKGAKKFISEAFDVLDMKRHPDLVDNVMRAQTYREKWKLLSGTIQGEIEWAGLADMDIYREKLEDFMASVSDDQLSAITTADSGFSVYDDVREKLVQQGIPENQIAFIHEYNSKAEKQELFDRVNAGEVRVLLGSTQKMGAGTNVQARAVVLHHLDAPWRPSDMEQREGRIVRQGNQLYAQDPDGFQIEIYAYSTENTFDAVMWQVLSRKASALEQFRQGKRVVEEVNKDSASYADFMAETTGNPIFREKFELQRKVDELDSAYHRARMQTASAREFLDRVAGRQRLERDRIQDAKTAQAKLPKDTATLAVQQPGEASVTLDADTVIENEKSKYDQEVVQYNNDQRDFLNHIFNLDQFLEKNKQIWQAFLSLYSQTTAHQFSNIRSVLAHIEGYGFDKKVLDELKKGVIPEIQEQNQPSKIPLPDKKPVKPIFPEIGSARINKHTPELNAFRKELLALNENATFTLDVNGIPVEITRTTGKEKRFDVDVNGRQVDWGTTVDRVLNYLRASQLNRLLTQAITLSQRELQRLQDEQVRSEAILRKANLDEMQSNLEAFKARYESIIQQVNAAEAQIAKDRRGQQNIYVERDTARDLSEQEEVLIEEGAGIDVDGTVVPDAPVNQDTTQPSRTLTQAPGVSRETFLNSITTRLPQLNREVLDKLLARGEQRQKGGLVLVESGNLDDITRVFAEKTGRTQDAAVQEIRGGGALSGLYDPHTGLTFAVLPNLSEQSAPAVLLHEAIHSQQRQQIDDAAVRLVNNREQAQPALRKFLNRVVARLEAAGATTDSREYAAYIVEEAVLQGRQNGFNAADGRFLDWVDRALGKPIGDVLRRFVNWIRGTLIQRGILLKTSALTVDDLVQWAQVGVVKQAQGRVKSTPILHQTNKPYERTQIFNIAAQIFFGNEIDTTKMVSASRKDRGRDVRPGRNGAGVSGESSPTGNRIGMVQPGNYLPLIRREVGAVQVDTFQTGIRKVETPEQAASVIAPISYEAQEFLTALVTDAQQKPLAILRHTIGTTSESQAEIAVLAGSVLNVPGAANVWFAHNHPGQKSTQSKDDNDLTDDLDNLLRGSGVYHHGMIVVAANQDASFFDPVTGEETALPKVQMTGKKTKIPVLGRRFVLFEEGDSIFNDTEQKDYLKQFDNTGLLFVDQDYRPVAWLDMSHEEMRQLRKGVTDQGAALLLRIVDRTNAMGALVKVRHASSDVKAVSNITTWLDNAGLVALGVYDAQGHKTIGQRSPSGVFKSVASNPIDYNQLAEDLKQLAQRTELFKFPKLKGKTLDALAAEIDPEIQVSRPDRGKDNPNRAQYKLDWTVDLTMPDGRVATVIKSGDRVMLNAIELNSSTSRGSELYQIVGAFAYQNHLKFSGDTAGISPAGSARRLEHMISLALKYGTTRFLEPHKDQNIPWQEGNDGYNIVQLLKKSVELISNDLPAIRDIRYDFTNKRFVNEKTGSAVSDAWFKALAKSFFPVRDESGNYARSEPAFAGSTTLKRAAIAHTLLQGNGREVRDGLLAWIARQLDSQRLDPGISGLFYSKSPTPAQAGVSASGLRETLLRGKAGVWRQARLEVEVVPSIADLPTDLQTALQDQTGVEGFYDAQTRKVVLIADQLPSEQRAREVLDHEIIGHWTTHNLREASEFLQLLNAVDRLEKVGNRKVRAAATKVDQEQPGLDRMQRGEEIFATLLESGEYARIPLIKTWADRVLQLIKTVLRRLGVQNDFTNNLTLNDVFRFARESRQRLESGEQSRTQWVFAGEQQIVQSKPMIEPLEGSRFAFSRTSSPEQARNILDEIGGVISNLEPQKNILERIKNHDELWPVLKQGAKDLAAKARPAWLKLLTRQQMVELLQDIPVIGKLATQFEQTARDMDADKSDLKQQAYDIAERWQRLLAKTRDRGLLLSQIMHLSTLEQVNPLEPPKFEDYNDHSSFSRATQVYQRLDGMMKKLRKQNPELADLYPAILKHYELMNALHFDALEARIGRSAVGIFRAMLDRVKETVVKGQPKTLTQALSALQQQDAAAYDALTDALLKRFGDHKMNKADTQALRNTLTPEAQQVFDDVLADVQEKVKRSLSSLSDFKRARSIKGPYFPLGRFGQFEVYAEKAGEALPTYAKFETQAEQIEAVKLLQKDGWTVKTNYQIQQAMQSRVPSDTAIGKMFIAVDENMDDPAAALALKDDLYQLYLESLPDLSVRKHFIHRQGIPGFSQDALRVFAQYMNSKSNAIARTRHSDVLTESLAKMESAKKRMGDDPLMNAREQARAAMVISELNSSYQWLMNPSNATWANRLTSFGFLWHLTNPATALVNLTQVPIMTFPDLAAKYGAGRATKMLARTIKEYGAWKFSTGAQRQKLQRDLGQEFNGDMQRMLDKLEKSGIISRTQTVALAGMGEHALEAEGSAKSSVGRAYAWAMDKGSWMFQKAEIANREISAIAAYRLARQQAEEKGNSAEDAHSHGVDVAYNVVARTQGDYSNANRAYVMRGNWRRVLFLFRSFSQLMTWRMLRDAYQSFKAASPEEKQEARSRLGWMTTSAFLFGGAAGVPIYSLVVGLVNAMFGADPDDPWDVETEVNQILDGLLGTTGRQAIMTGAVGQLPKLLGMSGVDLSPRVSIDLKHLWISDMPGDLEGQDAAQWVLNQALGPLVGTGLGFTKAWSQMAQASHDPNALLRGMEGLVPAPLRNALKAARYGTEGVTTRRGDLLIDDADWSMLLTQAIGFTPDQIADQYRINTGVYELKDAIEKRRRALQNRYVYAAESEDQGLMDETLEMIGRYNEMNPEFPITSNTLSQTYRHWLRARAEHENGIFIPSRGLRARINREN